MKSFEQKLNSPFFKYSKLVFDILVLNIIFILISLLSLFVLFFPGLVSIHKVMNNFVNNNVNSNNTNNNFIMNVVVVYK